MRVGRVMMEPMVAAYNHWLGWQTNPWIPREQETAARVRFCSRNSLIS